MGPRNGSARRAPGAGEAALRPGQHPAPPADFLSASRAINTEHLAATGKAREAIEHARRAGAMLLDLKARLGHGDFLPWLAANITFSERTAQRYMLLAEHWPAIDEKSASVADLTIAAALRAIPAKPRTWPDEVVYSDDVVVERVANVGPHSRHPALKGLRDRQPNREVERALYALRGICDCLVTLPANTIDPARAAEWAGALNDLGNKIRKVARQIRGRAP